MLWNVTQILVLLTEGGKTLFLRERLSNLPPDVYWNLRQL